MTFSFDQIINRRATDSMKWDTKPELLPLWVADMDFQSPPAVIQALHKQVSHGVFGYSIVPKDLPSVIQQRFLRLYNWQIKPEWIVFLPTLMAGLNAAVKASGAAGNQVITPTPVYYPTLHAPAYHQMHCVQVPLLQEPEGWQLDWPALEKAVNKKSCLFQLCNPHNPLGKMYSKAELQKVADFCLEHKIWLCSDEIHADLILNPNKKHIPIASLSAEIQNQSISLFSPSKGYNLPGLGGAFAIVPNPEIREPYIAAMRGLVPVATSLALTAMLAAYQQGDEWLAELLVYLKSNFDFLQQFLEPIPAAKLSTPLDATYLAWVDLSPVQQPALQLEQHGIWLSEGKIFGAPHFVRLNFACPSNTLEQALEKFKTAMAHLKTP